LERSLPGQVHRKQAMHLYPKVRATVYRTVYRFEKEGEDGLRDGRKRRLPLKATAETVAQLLRHSDVVPTEYGWQRAVWTLELLARQLEADTGACLSSSQTRKALESFGNRIHLHFLPPYSQDHSQIERLWQQLHDHVTRNHRHPTMASLWKDVVRFLEQVQPFPGTKVSTLRMVA